MMRYKKRYYFLGIAGSGVSGLAVIMKQRGFEVLGSEIRETQKSRELEDLGIIVEYGQKEEGQVGRCDVLVYTSAAGASHVQRRAAVREGLMVYGRGEFLASLVEESLAEGFGSVMFSGVHGKTTSTAMSACLFLGGRLSSKRGRSFVYDFAHNKLANNVNNRVNADEEDTRKLRIYLGAELEMIQNRSVYWEDFNTVSDGSDESDGSDDDGKRKDKKKAVFLFEGDESDGSFAKSRATTMVIGNLEEEHLDYYKTKEALQAYFFEYVEKSEDLEYLLLGSDERGGGLLQEMRGAFERLSKEREKEKGARKFEVMSFGLERGSTLFASHLSYEGGEMLFDVAYRGRSWGRFSMNFLGEHNVRNALGAMLSGYLNGLSVEEMRLALPKLDAIKKRQSVLLQLEVGSQKVDILEDYAHHPTEIRATVKALRYRYQRVYLFFQAHRLQRVRGHELDFARALESADGGVVLPIFVTREAFEEGPSHLGIYEHLSAHLKLGGVDLLKTGKNRASEGQRLAGGGFAFLKKPYNELSLGERAGVFEFFRDKFLLSSEERAEVFGRVAVVLMGAGDVGQWLDVF